MHHYECIVPNIDRVDDSEPRQLLRSGRVSLISGPAG